MKAICECGRPAVARGRKRAKSSRNVRTGRPAKMKGHDLCPECFEKLSQTRVTMRPLVAYYVVDADGCKVVWK
jgi:hypothetical protein